MDALHQARRGGLDSRDEDWAFQRAMLEHLTAVWNQPDEGIWEVRGAPPAVHLLEGDGLGGVRPRHPGDGGIRARGADAITGGPCVEPFTTMCARAASIRELGSFVQSYGSKELDASLLLLPTVGFLPPTDPRIRGTIEAVERRLFVDGFLLRYDTAHER